MFLFHLSCCEMCLSWHIMMGNCAGVMRMHFMPRTFALLLALLCVVSAARAQLPTTPPMKVIFDTDIGDDIDDAYALALVTSLPDVKLLGVTTSFGQTRERAELAAKLLRVMGHNNVPV